MKQTFEDLERRIKLTEKEQELYDMHKVNIIKSMSAGYYNKELRKIIKEATDLGYTKRCQEEGLWIEDTVSYKEGFRKGQESIREVIL